MEHGGDMAHAHAAAHGGHKHGSLGGHVLPGSFFIAWSTWWFVNISAIYIHRAQRRKPYRSHAHFRLSGSAFPLEPTMKIVLCIVGIMGELYFSHHGHWRSLYDSDGKFWTGHLNNWQHTAMFSAFIVSGLVDLVGLHFQLPPSTEHAFLGLAFIVEGLLLAFHIKGTMLERHTHLMLALLIFACAAATLVEAACPEAPALFFARCYFVALQGTWFCQAGRVLFLGAPQWDDSDEMGTYMGASMMLPVVLATHMLAVAAVMLGAYLLVAYSMGGLAATQRGFEAIERANDAPAAKVALLDFSTPGPNEAARKATQHRH